MLYYSLHSFGFEDSIVLVGDKHLILILKSLVTEMMRTLNKYESVMYMSYQLHKAVIISSKRILSKRCSYHSLPIFISKWMDSQTTWFFDTSLFKSCNMYSITHFTSLYIPLHLEYGRTAVHCSLVVNGLSTCRSGKAIDIIRSTWSTGTAFRPSDKSFMLQSEEAFHFLNELKFCSPWMSLILLLLFEAANSCKCLLEGNEPAVYI